MKRLATVFALSVTVLLSGCSGVPGPAPTSTLSTTQPPVVPPPTPTPVPPPAPPRVPPPTPNPVPPPVPDITGNWQFTAASTVLGKPPFTFAGSISQAGSSVSGALHVDGSTCFNRLTTMGLTGTVTADNTSLTSFGP